MVFTGTYEHRIDSKKRLAIPSEIRGQIQAEEGSNQGAAGILYLYVTLGEGQALCLYTEAGFEQRAEELDHSELDPEQLLTYERLLFSLARRVEIDKQGRVRLPEQLLAMAKFDTEVVLIGVKDHLEIRDRQTWKEHVASALETYPGIRMNPRRAMKSTQAHQ